MGGSAALFDDLDQVRHELGYETVLLAGGSGGTRTALVWMRRHPERVIGMHFFSPANVMKLLENVRGENSSDTVVASTMAIGKRINKVPVMVGVCRGFVGNRMLFMRGAPGTSPAGSHRGL